MHVSRAGGTGTMNMLSSMHKSVLDVCIILHRTLIHNYARNLTLDRLIHLASYVTIQQLSSHIMMSSLTSKTKLINYN